MNEKGPPEFSFPMHQALAAEELKTIQEKRKREPNQVVTLTCEEGHKDESGHEIAPGTKATVNADPTDPGYIAFTAKGFKVADADKHLVVAPKTESQEKQALMDRLAVLEARLGGASSAVATTAVATTEPAKKSAAELRADADKLEADEKAAEVSKQKLEADARGTVKQPAGSGPVGRR